jgi:uncharacterized delta-60 repeat protein
MNCGVPGCIAERLRNRYRVIQAVVGNRRKRSKANLAASVARDRRGAPSRAPEWKRLVLQAHASILAGSRARRSARNPEADTVGLSDFRARRRSSFRRSLSPLARNSRVAQNSRHFNAVSQERQAGGIRDARVIDRVRFLRSVHPTATTQATGGVTVAATFRNVRRRLRALTIGLPLMLMTAGAAVGAPGDLDLTFGRGGRVFINMDANAETAAPLVQQGDGRLLLGRGTNFMVATGVDLSVVRLNPDGRPDADFGGNGMASTDVPGITASTRVVVRQDADKIIVAGPAWSDDNPNRVFAAIVRYLADGTLDATFGSRGVLLEDFGATGASIDALVVLPDGRLVAAGYADKSGGRRDMAFARFNTNGSIDTTFGSMAMIVASLRCGA